MNGNSLYSHLTHFFRVSDPLSFREIKILDFRKVLYRYLRQEFVEKRKTGFIENFREKTQGKTFVPALVPSGQ
jgi:hypothetical protein